MEVRYGLIEILPRISAYAVQAEYGVSAVGHTEDFYFVALYGVVPFSIPSTSGGRRLISLHIRIQRSNKKKFSI